MTLDHRLIDMLVCPLCKGPLEAGRDNEGRLVELECRADKLAFAIHDGIPVMLESEARTLATPATPMPPPAGDAP
ncbi:MAG TPA: Trm112 family protein [Burkholderiaceae bacterium]|nr:Trm112 family protein [Burkholderiaceae bacterium]